MFDNIGDKIKTVAMVQMILGCVGSIILAIILAEEIDEGSLLIAIVGIVLSIVSAFILYGFGRLVENSDIMIDLLEEQSELLTPKKTTPSQVVNHKNATYPEPTTSEIVREASPKLNAAPIIQATKPVLVNQWCCDRCGYKNSIIYATCRNCGKDK